VSNGRLVEQTTTAGRTRFRWAHDYPLETYSVTLNVAPYVCVATELELPGLERPVPFAYWVLPGSVLKARIQFRDVPDMLRVFSEAFGPFPFPASKFGLVETNFWGMEHSTAVAYGSSYPAWCAETGERDRFASRYRFFDYILVHESAHEWWGNAVSAASWGDFWIHEGFATYAEGVYLERLKGRETADEWLASIRRQIGRRSRLWRGDVHDAREAYGNDIYYKGAWVLETLRQYVRDDGAWWRSLRDFNERYRYGNATTDDFLAVLAEHTGRDWTRFRDEWIRGEGWPEVTGSVRADDAGFSIDVRNEGSASTGFHVPLDLVYTVAGEPAHERVWLEPGENTLAIDHAGPGPIADLRLEGLGRILGEHDVVTVSR
jgi:aminopeptidase N